MIFNRHTSLEGAHAPFSPSQPSWLRYDDDKAIEIYTNKKAAEMGTKFHEWAKNTIDLGIKQPRCKKTLYDGHRGCCILFRSILRHGRCYFL